MALIKCPDCGSEVSDAAPACPKCGRPIAAPPPAPRSAPAAAPPKKNKNLSGVTVLVVFGLLGWFIYGMANSDGQTQSTTSDHGANDSNAVAPSKPTMEVTPDELQTAYDTNEVAADNIYKGKVIRIIGKIASIDKDFTDDVVIQLATSNQFMHVSASMIDAERDRAANLRKGQSISLDCESVMRVIGTPAASKCRFSTAQ